MRVIASVPSGPSTVRPARSRERYGTIVRSRYVSVPFISDQGWQMGLRNCCLLALLNLIYFARARTEERHLSRDPDYVAYALWINDHGLLRHVGRLLPFLRYRAPAGLP